jgi:hypothetical protein
MHLPVEVRNYLHLTLTQLISLVQVACSFPSTKVLALLWPTRRVYLGAFPCKSWAGR